MTLCSGDCTSDTPWHVPAAGCDTPGTPPYRAAPAQELAEGRREANDRRQSWRTVEAR